jgi:hypothetical protein
MVQYYSIDGSDDDPRPHSTGIWVRRSEHEAIVRELEARVKELEAIAGVYRLKRRTYCDQCGAKLPEGGWGETYPCTICKK